MLSTLYHEQFASKNDPQNSSKHLKFRFGYPLDELVVLGLVAVVVFYIAAASCWFIM